MKNVIFAAMALATSASPAVAEVIECVLTKRNADWVPEQILILRDEKSGKIIVNDPLIAHFNKKPVEAALDRENAKRLTVKWSLENIVNQSGQRTLAFLYRATYLKANKEIVVRAKPKGYGNEFEGRGKCTIRAKP